MYESLRRLHPRGPTNVGVAVDAEGAMLGPDCVLVRRTARGYRCIGRDEAAALQDHLFADSIEPDWLFGQCRRIAKALNGGQTALPQIFGLRIPIVSLDSGSRKQLAAAAPFIKANFNPDEPRIPAGRRGGGAWTTGGAAEGSTPVLSVAERDGTAARIRGGRPDASLIPVQVTIPWDLPSEIPWEVPGAPSEISPVPFDFPGAERKRPRFRQIHFRVTLNVPKNGKPRMNTVTK